jgi:putative transposase
MARMLRLKAYRFRLQPTPSQARQLADWSHSLRFVWNWMLAQRRDAYRASEGRVKVGYGEQAAQLPPLKQVFPWLGLLPSQALQQTLLDLDQAFANFFAGRARYPAFKKRGRGSPGLRWPQGVEMNGRCLWLAKLGWVKARFSRRVAGRIKRATVRFDGLQWYVAILTEEEVEAPSLHPGPDLGIDVGIVESLAFSDGRTCRLPVATAKEERRSRLLARRISRCRAGSVRHRRAQRRQLVFRRRIANRVNDARNKLTSTLAKNHGRVFVEDLALRSLTRSARGTVEAPGRNVAAKAALNRALLEQGHAETFRQLSYKLLWLGGQLKPVPAAFTSQRCPECGHTCPENRPSRDRFQCVACGHAGHADHVAARNLLAAGQAAAARGGSREPMKREPTRSRRFPRRPAGIPAL